MFNAKPMDFSNFTLVSKKHTEVYLKKLIICFADNFMESISSTNIVKRSFPLEYGENFCVDISYSGGVAGGAPVLVSNATNTLVYLPLPPSDVNEWRNVRIEKYLHPGNYQISVSVEQARFYIGGIRFCKTGKILKREIKRLN
jgi:hypothetical protein